MIGDQQRLNGTEKVLMDVPMSRMLHVVILWTMFEKVYGDVGWKQARPAYNLDAPEIGTKGSGCGTLELVWAAWYQLAVALCRVLSQLNFIILHHRGGVPCQVNTSVLTTALSLNRMTMSDPARILRAIERGSLLTVSRLTASYTIQALYEFLLNTDALLLASALPTLDILVFLLDESSLASAADQDQQLGSLKVWRETSTQNSLLHIAASKGQLEVLDIYLQRCPFTLELCNRAGQTALHLAAREGHLELVTYLLSAGALPDLTDDRGNTALHYAAQWNRRPVVDTLLASGANYLARNEAGWLPSDVAYDFSLQREIQDKVRELAESQKKLKARRRIEKQQQQAQQRELRRVESEQSLASRFGGAGVEWPYQHHGQTVQRQKKGSDWTTTSMPLASADALSTVAPSDFSIPMSQSSSSNPPKTTKPHSNGYDGKPFYSFFSTFRYTTASDWITQTYMAHLIDLLSRAQLPDKSPIPAPIAATTPHL